MKNFFATLLIISGLLLSRFQIHPVQAAFTDRNYGYSLTDTATYTWIDASGGQTIKDFGVTNYRYDDETAGPLSLGFNFPFYENTYNSLYMSINGLLSFDPMFVTYTTNYNSQLPVDSKPNALIAAFWDDLLVDQVHGGKVFFLTGGAPGNQYAVIEWQNAVILNHSDLLTFEIILYENGTILLSYQNVGGTLNTCSIGIEDTDGTDGITYLYHQNGLASGKTIQITRPGNSEHIKGQPVYQSSFIGGSTLDFPFSIKNISTSTNPTDTYQLSSVLEAAYPSSSTAWPVSFYSSDGKTITNSVNVAQNTQVSLLARISLPTFIPTGAYQRFQIIITSSNNPAKNVVLKIQAAKSASFAQIYHRTDSANNVTLSGLNIQVIDPSQPQSIKIANEFTGRTMVVSSLPNKRYLVAWEKQGIPHEGIQFSDIEYILVDSLTSTTSQIMSQTSNFNQSLSTMDRLPNISITQTGVVGMLYLRNTFMPDFKMNSNIWLQLMNLNGQTLGDAINLTNNSDFNFEAVYANPVLTATTDNRFVAVWEERHNLGGGITSNDLNMAVYTANGSRLSGPARLTNSAGDGWAYSNPSLNMMRENHIFLACTAQDASKNAYIKYMTYLSDGNLANAGGMLSGGETQNLDTTFTSQGANILTWSNTNDNAIYYSVISSDGNSIIKPPTALLSPDGHKNGSVSVTYDLQGRAILTWMDTSETHALYYTLINSQGEIITPPMSFLSGTDLQPIIQTSPTGGGSAFYQWGRQFVFPLIH